MNLYHTISSLFITHHVSSPFTTPYIMFITYVSYPLYYHLLSHTLYHQPLSHPVSSFITPYIINLHAYHCPVSSSFTTPCIITLYHHPLSHPVSLTLSHFVSSCIILYHILHYHILSHAVSSMHGKICITSHIKPRPISDTVLEILTDMGCDINFVMPT